MAAEADTAVLTSPRRMAVMLQRLAISPLRALERHVVDRGTSVGPPLPMVPATSAGQRVIASQSGQPMPVSARAAPDAQRKSSHAFRRERQLQFRHSAARRPSGTQDQALRAEDQPGPLDKRQDRRCAARTVRCRTLSW